MFDTNAFFGTAYALIAILMMFILVSLRKMGASVIVFNAAWLAACATVAALWFCGVFTLKTFMPVIIGLMICLLAWGVALDMRGKGGRR